MRQSEEIEASMEDYRRKRIERKKRMLRTDRSELKHLFCKVLDDLINLQTDRQLCGEQEGIRYVYLCRLESSRYTESYKVLLGMSSSMLYLDEFKTDILWYPEPVYRGMKEDMEYVRKLDRENRERPDSKLLLEWKQELLKDNWELLKDQYQELIEENYDRITDSSLLVDESFSALCGDYMEPLPTVWEAQKK